MLRQKRHISHTEMGKLLQTWQQRALIPGTSENTQFLTMINLAEMKIIAIYESIIQYFLQTYLEEQQQEIYEADNAAYEAETAGKLRTTQPTEKSNIQIFNQANSKSSDVTATSITRAMQANNQAWKQNIQQSSQAVTQAMLENNITIPGIGNNVILPTSDLGKRIIAVSLGAESPSPTKVLTVVYKSILEYNKELPPHNKMLAPSNVKQTEGTFNMMNQLRVVDIIRETFFGEEDESFSSHNFTILKTVKKLDDAIGFILKFNDQFQSQLKGQNLPTKLEIFYKAINIAKLAAQTEFNKIKENSDEQNLLKMSSARV